MANLTPRFRLYANEPYIEMITTVGPIDISDDYGKEVIVQTNTSVGSAGVCYTDSHGLEFARREFDILSAQFIVDNPISGNYYPISMAGYIM